MAKKKAMSVCIGSQEWEQMTGRDVGIGCIWTHHDPRAGTVRPSEAYLRVELHHIPSAGVTYTKNPDIIFGICLSTFNLAWCSVSDDLVWIFKGGDL